MEIASKIFVAGHTGLVGSAIVRRLRELGYRNLLLCGRAALDLRDQAAVDAFFSREKPEYVFLAAAKVGGILANSSYPAEFIRDNLVIQSNVIHSAWSRGVSKLQFLGSSCIYPKFAPQPIQEGSLLAGALEPSNEWYAVAKIAGVKMAQAYWAQYGFRAISLMPTNLYGPGDNFDLLTSHVLPALIRKFHDARRAENPSVLVWGSGAPRREFLHVDDLASAAVFLMLRYESPDILNVGAGEDISIADLARLVAEITGFEGEIVFDRRMPDGAPRKLLDVAALNRLGWTSRISLRDGIAQTYAWFLERGA